MLKLSFYNLVQFLKIYISSKKIETLIVIYLYKAWKWLSKLGYDYKNVRKDIFVDKHEQTNIVEDHRTVFKRLEELKPYIIKFKKDSKIKPKIYSANCIIGKDKQQLIIVIIYNKYIFSANNEIWIA